MKTGFDHKSLGATVLGLLLVLALLLGFVWILQSSTIFRFGFSGPFLYLLIMFAVVGVILYVQVRKAPGANTFERVYNVTIKDRPVTVWILIIVGLILGQTAGLSDVDDSILIITIIFHLAVFCFIIMRWVNVPGSTVPSIVQFREFLLRNRWYGAIVAVLTILLVSGWTIWTQPWLSLRLLVVYLAGLLLLIGAPYYALVNTFVDVSRNKLTRWLYVTNLALALLLGPIFIWSFTIITCDRAGCGAIFTSANPAPWQEQVAMAQDAALRENANAIPWYIRAQPTYYERPGTNYRVLQVVFSYIVPDSETSVRVSFEDNALNWRKSVWSDDGSSRPPDEEEISGARALETAMRQAVISPAGVEYITAAEVAATAQGNPRLDWSPSISLNTPEGRNWPADMPTGVTAAWKADFTFDRDAPTSSLTIWVDAISGEIVKREVPDDATN